ncbi:MAG TPA: hypothetical protein VN947_00270 [Polyangia bacterium]|nr:hypothetical protein [Polyangia bacterium]
MRVRRGTAAVILGAALLLAGGAARAETATCDIPIIHALPGGSNGPQIDPKIDRLRSYFSQPPFTAWHDFKLLDRKTLTLQENQPVQFEMPNSRPATITFLGHTPGPGEHRMRLRLWIDHPEKHHRTIDTTFVLDEGGVVLHVGQKHEGGVLILAVSCKTRD